METYIAPPLVWCLGALTVGYLVLVGVFMNYLKRAHHETWLALGSPSIVLNNSIRNGLLTARYIFSGRHKVLGDPRLDLYILAIRILLGAIVAMWLIAFATVPRPPSRG